MVIDTVSSPNFLGICAKVEECSQGVSKGFLKLSNWDQSETHSAMSLLLEGVNQFAVRFVTKFSQHKDENYRYLPVMIEYFNAACTCCTDEMEVTGSIELVNDVYRVKCVVTGGSKQGAVIAQASILVAKVYLPHRYSQKMTASGVPSLWAFSFASDTQCWFKFESEHPLFEEHFPSRAVCPGSMLIDVLLSRVKKEGGNTRVELSKVKFIDTVYPGVEYQLLTKWDPKDKNTGVFYIQSIGKTRYTCGRFVIN